MAHKLTITLDDRSFANLEKIAHQRGETPEGIASGAVQTVLKNPLLALAGCLDTGVPDLALRHNDYLAEPSPSVPMTVREEAD